MYLKRMITTPTEVGIRLRQLRRHYGLTADVLADRLGVSTPAVTTWENAKRRITVERLLGICDLYGISAAEFFGSSVDDPPPVNGDGS
jgi:transcriptional regulator with XRE-family HTH domain